MNCSVFVKLVNGSARYWINILETLFGLEWLYPCISVNFHKLQYIHVIYVCSQCYLTIVISSFASYLSKGMDCGYEILWVLSLYEVTECRGGVVSTPALYSGNLGFKSLPADRLSRLRVFVVFLSPSSECQDSTLKYATAASFQILSNSLFTYLFFHSTL
jgi:hypothetical protein